MSKREIDKNKSGEFYKLHSNLILEKLINYGSNLKQMKESYKNMLKAMEATSAAMEVVIASNNLIADTMRRGRPQSSIADNIPLASTFMETYEIERLSRCSNFVNNLFPVYEKLYEKKLKSIKNYIKNFEIEDKDRLIAIKKFNAKSSSRKSTAKEPIEGRDDAADKYFDLRTAREDCLRKMLTEENILYTNLLEINNLLIKNNMFLNDSYSLRTFRPVTIAYQHLLKEVNSIPPECDYVIRNPSLFLDLNNKEQHEEVAVFETPEIQSHLDLYKFKSLQPISLIPKLVKFQYISIDTKEIDLVVGDIIIIYTDVFNGWQYGINIITKCSGWFPVSFAADSKNPDDINLLNEFLEKIQKF